MDKPEAAAKERGMQQADEWQEPELSQYPATANLDVSSSDLNVFNGRIPEPYVSDPNAPGSYRADATGLDQYERAARPASPLPGRASWLEMSLNRPPVIPLTSKGFPKEDSPASANRRLASGEIDGDLRADNQNPNLIHESARSPVEHLAGGIGALAHDARNMLSALDLYCDLLEEPGVLWAPFAHYAGELRLVAGASRRLVEKLAMLECVGQFPEHYMSPDSRNSLEINALHADAFQASVAGCIPDQHSPVQPSSEFKVLAMPLPHDTSRGLRIVTAQSPHPSGQAPIPAGPIPTGTVSPLREGPSRLGRRPILHAMQPIESLAEELLANQNLLSALAGPGITVGLSISGGLRPVAMSGNDLTRVLVNLVKNAVDAMPAGGHIQISLEEVAQTAQTPGYLCLSVADTGCGIPSGALQTIFDAGYSTHVGIDTGCAADLEPWPNHHRGLGLAIVRSIVSAAGGTSRAANRTGGKGAVFQLDFPVPVSSD
jgi:hypothetical protein